MMGRTKIARWRAAALICVNLFMIAHLIQWAIVGMTVAPIEPSEAMETLEVGVVNAGAIFFLIAILSTILLGRFFCGWACHIVSLQDACAWLMTQCGVRPKPFRSRLLVYFPFALGMYMFVWPSFKRVALAPALSAMSIDWPAWIKPVGPIHQWSSGLIVDDFWATMPPWWVAIPFLFICGFAAVYFLGAKGFCTYGCPYAAFFKPLDTIAPVRIRVNDNCQQCGYCTSACTSNVRVSEEVRDFGMVVDPGCMKTLDCISACPNDALSLGIGKIALGAKPRSPETYKKAKAKRAGRYDMAKWEEVLAAVLLLWFFFATRGSLDAVPMLMAGGLAAIGVMIVIMALKLVHEPHVRLYRFAFKAKGRVRPMGYALVLVALGFVVASLWSGQARFYRWRGDVLYAGAEIPGSVLLREEFQPSPSQRARALAAIRAYRRADSPSEGGMGWKLNPEHRLRLSYFLSTIGDHQRGLAELERVIREGHPTGDLVRQAAQVAIRAIDDNPPAGMNAGELAALKRERMLGLYQMALDAHPDLHGIRTELSRSAYSVQDTEKGDAYWEVTGYEDDPIFIFSHAGYTAFKGDMVTTRALLEEAAERASSMASPAGTLANLAIAAMQYGFADLAQELIQRAIDDPSATAQTWLASGEVANALGDTDLGTQRAQHALTMPWAHTPMVQARAAGVLLKPGEIEQGLDLLVDAAERAHDPFEVMHIAQGMTYAGSGLNAPELTDRGLEIMKQVAESNPQLYVIGHDYARTLYSMGRHEEALGVMTRVAQADATNPVLASRVADLLSSMGRNEESAQWRDEAQRRQRPAHTDAP